MSRRSFARAVTTYGLQPLLDLTSMVDTECAPCAESVTAAAEVAPVIPPTSPSPRWSGVIGVEGELTGDGRLIEANALRWENLPIPLRYVGVDVGFHDGAQVVGQIDKITRSGGKILGEGTLDLGSDVGMEAHRVLANKIVNGVSMDLDDVSFEIRVAADLLDDAPLGGLLLAEGDEAPPLPKPDKDGRVKVAEIGSDDEVRVTTSGRIRAATVVAIPAFADAQIFMVDEMADTTEGPAEDCSCVEGEPNYDPNCVCPDQTEEPPALAAAGIPVSPPAAWFNRSTFTGPTALKVTPEGQVYGHLAAWESCHISHTQSGCVTPPHSATGYAYFLTGTVLTAEGAEIPVGHLTMNTRHAGDKLSMAATLAHYEDTGKVAADVTVWEDEWGIAFAGALRPGLTDQQIREFRAAPLSGDWRRTGGNLELVAALAVNVPGFPIPRPSGLVAAGQVQTLVASGMIPPGLVRLPGTPGALSEDDLKYLKRLADRERAADTIKAAGTVVPDAAAMARRVRASQLAMRVHRGKD